MKDSLKRLKLFLLIMMLGIVSLSTMAKGAVLAPGTAISNQATVNFTRSDSVPRSALSNTVTTIVNNVYALSLEWDPNSVDYANNYQVWLYPGQAYNFTHILTNKGNTADTYVLGHNYSSAYNVEFYRISNEALEPSIPEGANKITELTMSPGEQAKILVVIKNTDVNAQPGTINTALIKATSKQNTARFAESSETIKYAEQANVTVMKSFKTADGTATITGLNSKNEETITIALDVFNTAKSQIDTIRNYDLGSGYYFTLEDVLDDRFKYVAGSARWAGMKNGATITLTDADESTSTSGVKYSYDAQTKKIKFYMDEVFAGTNASTKGTLTFQVKVPAKTLAASIVNKAPYNYQKYSEQKVTGEATAKYDILKYAEFTFTGQEVGQAVGGSIVKFENVLTNTANAPEKYSFKLAAANTFPSGTVFDVTIDDGKNTEYSIKGVASTVTGELVLNAAQLKEDVPVNGSIKVNLYAALPSNLTAGTVDYQIKKVATSIFNSLVTHEATDSVKSITLQVVVTIAPANTGYLYLGGTKTYSHTITNTGNGTVTKAQLTDIGLTNDKAGWTTKVYLNPELTTEYVKGSSGNLPDISVDGVVTIYVKVTPSPTTYVGEVNVTKLTGVLTGGGVINNYAVDTTTVRIDHVKIEKFQANVKAGPYTKELMTANPGDTIHYMIVVTNTSTALENETATAVVIKDAVPAYTSLIDLPRWKKGESGNYVYDSKIQHPVMGSGGEITATLGDLKATEKLYMQFSVKIDE